MATDSPPRLEVVLSAEERASLDRLLRAGEETDTDWVRRKLQEDCAAAARAQRQAAVRFLLSLNVEGPTDLKELRREIDLQDDPLGEPWNAVS